MKIAIIGCGYIGMGAASMWKSQGHEVIGTTRKPERLEELAPFVQESALIQGNDPQEFASLIADNDVILVTVAADNFEQYEETYLRIAQMIKEASGETEVPKKLIYTSSSSVYGDHQGEWVDEESELRTETVPGKILIQTEQVYQTLETLGWDVTILRLSEIYGPGRDLSQRVKNLPSFLPGSGEYFTNMIHKADCVAAIDYVLQHKLTGIFNLADDDHPTRKGLYEALALKFGYPPPRWDPTRTSLRNGNKRVSNHKIKSTSFVFKYPHRVLS